MVEHPAFEPRAILVADMVGYSRWLAQQPAATHTAFTTHVRHVFEPTVRAHAGHVIKTTGDGIIAIFDDTGDAESCAQDIQIRLEAHDIGIAPEVQLQYRVAVHYGNIMILPDDVFGIDVNVAMHMQRLASPGGICISRDLFFRLDESRKALYTYAGSKYVKNVPDPLDVYLYNDASGASRDSLKARQPPALRRRMLSPPPRVGIADLHVHAEHESRRIVATFAQEALMEGFARFRDLLAVAPVGTEIARSSGVSGELREYLSKQLALKYLVHGSCVVTSDAVILIIHFEYLKRREIVWSTRVKADPRDLGGMAAQMTVECVTPIVLHLQRNEHETRDVLDSEDEQLFREAQRLMSQRTLQAADQARRILAGILERSGEIGNVYLALARAEHSHGLLLAGERFGEALERARDFARMAVELDDLNPRAHGELALQDLFLKRYASAVEGYQRALRLNPYDPLLLADWADCLAMTGKAEEAVPILENLWLTSPSDRAWVDWNLCDAAWVLDQPGRVIEILRDKPDLPHAHRLLAASYAKLGQMPEARSHADQVRRHQPNFSAREWRKVVPWQPEPAEEYADCLALAGL